MSKIEKYKPNTQRSYIISIVSLLKEEPKQKKLYDVYYKILMEFNKKLKENTEKSEKQVENWITQDEVKKIFDNLHQEVLTTLKPRKCSDYIKLLSFIVLSLYVLNAPRRNKDYQDMLITINYNDEKDKKFNYFDFVNKKFYFNNYKTQSTYKTQEITVSDELYNILTMFLKYHPLIKELKKKDIYLLVDSEGNPLSSNNAITRILNKIFDKKIGSSMLRNIYLTTKYASSNKEKQLDATAMGNSIGVIDSNYVKTD